MGTRSTVQRRARSVLLAATLLSGAAAALAPPAWADPNTWVVHSGGDDSNSCVSEFSACATIAGALAKASSGDIVEVGAGSYAVPVTISMPISLQPISATDVGTITGPVTIADDIDNVTIDGLHFAGPQSAISAGPTNALTLTNNTFDLTGTSGAAIVLAVPDQADVLNATLGGNTGTVGSGMRTIAETGSGTITVTPTATPNTITSATASLTIGVPASIHTGAAATSFAGTANTGGLDLAAARYDILITGDPNLTAAQLALSYEAAPNDLETVPLTDTADGITGYFGPHAGFPFPAGSRTTHFELSVADGAPGGSVHVTTTLDEIAAQTGDPVLNTIASTTNDVTIIANNKPVAVPPGAVQVPFNKTAPITLSGTDVDSDPLTYTVEDPPHGTLTGTAPNLTYTPDSGYSGPDSFTFTVNDGFEDSDPATVNITVAANHVPQVSGAAVSVPFQGTTTVTLHGTDADSDRLTYSIAGQPHHGTLTGSGATRTYRAAKGYAGTDSFSFKANDGTVNSGVARVTITVGKATVQIVAVQFSPAHPTTGQSVKAAVTLSTPGTANGGRIELREGSKLYWARVSGKTATVILGRLPAGTHNFTVRFDGTSTAHTTHVSANPLRVSKVPKVPKVSSSLHVSSSPQQLTTKSHGTAIIRVSAAHAHVDGALVTIRQGSRTLGSGRVKGGVAKIALPRLSLGQHNLTVHYAGTPTATAATRTWIVRVALG